MKTSLRFDALMYAFFSSFLLLPSAFPQGSLTPPGAPAPTMKSLDQVEPRIAINATNTPGDANSLFKITLPGSYYLTGNVTGVSGKTGIEIASNNVTIDLNGFTLQGVGGSLAGINNPSQASEITVRNGAVTGFAGIGVDLGGAFGFDLVIEHIRASENGNGGIQTGANSIVRACNARLDGPFGIKTAGNSTVTECNAYNNGIGISAGSGSTVMGCTARGNFGAYGIFADTGSTLNNCTAIDNAGAYGIFAGEGSTLNSCTAHSNNVEFGIHADDRSTLTNCTASLNTSAATDSRGISVGAQCTVSNCTASGNLNTNGTPSGSTGGGILVGISSNVTNCTVVGNKGDGIQVAADARVVGNNCDSNGFGGGDAAGIHSTSADNRIEGNNVTDNTRGIDVDAGGSLIIKNSASGNTSNYEIAAGNAVGAIVVTAASVVISGSGPFPSSLTSTDPWANFSF